MRRDEMKTSVIIGNDFSHHLQMWIKMSNRSLTVPLNKPRVVYEIVIHDIMLQLNTKYWWF